MSLFQSPDASVYLSHPLALCQFVNMSFLSLVLLGECSAFDISLFRASHSSHACKYNIFIVFRECTWISPEAITLAFLPNCHHTYTKNPTPLHLFLVLPSCPFFCLYAPALTTHTLPLLLNQQREVPGGGDPSQWQVECCSQQNSHVWLCLCLWRRPCQSVIYTGSNNIWWSHAADSYYSATEKNMVHFALKFFNPGMKSYSFGLISLSVGEAALPLANEVFLDQSTCK